MNSDRKKTRPRLISLGVLFFLLTVHPFISGAASSEIKEVVARGKSESVQIYITDKVVYKVIRIDSTEALVAFKNVTLSHDFKFDFETSVLVDDVGIEKLPNNVVALLISTKRPIKSLKAEWVSGKRILRVDLITEKQKEPVREVSEAQVALGEPLKQPVKIENKTGLSEDELKKTTVTESKEELQKDTVVELKEEPKALTKKVSLLPSKYDGNIDDFIIDIKDDFCYESFELRPVVTAVTREKWNQVFDLTESVIIENVLTEKCGDFLYYLRSYAFSMLNVNKNNQLSLETFPMLNEALRFYPDSIYKPFGMLLMATSYQDLANNPMAKGYLELLYEKYDTFPGTPEVLFKLGKIYNNENQPDLAIISFQKIISNYSGTQIIPDAKIELGKALFNKNHFIDSLSQLQAVRDADYRKIYENKDLLLYIGNANHELGNTVEAREALIKVLNLYPDIKEKDIVLTHIGDTYAKENMINKALKIYRIVTTQYVGTDGFIVSSIRLARYLKDRSEKEAIYRMIINEYPDHDMFRLAMMRLGELQYQHKEYASSLDTMHQFLGSNPRTLKLEIYDLMEKNYAPLFLKLQKKERYPEILSRYESDKNIIDDFENPGVFLSVAKSYLDGFLYEDAFNAYLNVYRLLDKKERTGDLLADLALTMKETARYDSAVKMYDNFIRYYPKNKRKSEAYKQVGEVLLIQEKYIEALNNLKSALKLAKKKDEKAGILVLQAQTYKGMGEYSKSVPLLIAAINHYSSLPDSYFDKISSSYKMLGEVNMAQSKYGDAVDSFEMSIKFSKDKTGTVGILFMIGNAYQVDEDFENAKKVYRDIIALDDPFWGKLAVERIKSIDLKLRLKRT